MKPAIYIDFENAENPVSYWTEHDNTTPITVYHNRADIYHLKDSLRNPEDTISDLEKILIENDFFSEYEQYVDNGNIKGKLTENGHKILSEISDKIDQFDEWDYLNKQSPNSILNLDDLDNIIDFIDENGEWILKSGDTFGMSEEAFNEVLDDIISNIHDNDPSVTIDRDELIQYLYWVSQQYFDEIYEYIYDNTDDIVSNNDLLDWKSYCDYVLDTYYVDISDTEDDGEDDDTWHANYRDALKNHLENQ
jgi:hypothetical protein